MIVFVNQQTTVPPVAPTTTASSVRVGLQKINGAWLIDALDQLWAPGGAGMPPKIPRHDHG
jgi:hypothetical protein